MIKRIILTAALLGAPALAQQASGGTATDAGGNFYPVTARFDGRKDYIHIAKLDASGYQLWEGDYASNYSQKPVAAAAGPNGLIILSARQMQGYKTLALSAYSYQNFLMWETAFDNGAQIIPTALAIDAAGSIYACGQVRDQSGQYRAKVWKYDRNGGSLWTVDYNGYGNSYAQLLHIMYNGNIEVGVKVLSGGRDYGQYNRLSLVYNTNGQLLN